VAYTHSKHHTTQEITGMTPSSKPILYIYIILLYIYILYIYTYIAIENPLKFTMNVDNSLGKPMDVRANSPSGGP
jgi:hypothetical protein